MILRHMRTKLLILLLALSLPLTGRSADDSIAGPKVDPSNRSQVPWRTTDDGSGHQSLHVVVDSGGGSGGDASAANQQTQITAEQAILAKITSDPATQTTLAAILAKIIAAPATEAKQPSLGTATAPSANVLTTQRPTVTQVVSTVLERAKILKGGPGQLVQLSVFNSGPAQFILLANQASIAGDGALPLLFPPIPIAAGQLLVLDLPAPLVASTGITVHNSTTGTFTKTSGADDCIFYAQVN